MDGFVRVEQSLSWERYQASRLHGAERVSLIVERPRGSPETLVRPREAVNKSLSRMCAMAMAHHHCNIFSVRIAKFAQLVASIEGSGQAALIYLTICGRELLEFFQPHDSKSAFS